MSAHNQKMVRRLTIQPLKLKSEIVQMACAAMDNIHCSVAAGQDPQEPADHKFGYLTLTNVRLLEVAFTSSDSTNLLGREVEGTLHLKFEEVLRPF